MKRRATIIGSLVILITFTLVCAYAGQVTLTTYYPAPYGNYKSVTASVTSPSTVATTGYKIGPDMALAISSKTIAPTTYTNYYLFSSPNSSLTTATENTCLGTRAGQSLTTGKSNTLVGYEAGINLIGQGSGGNTGSKNTLLGYKAGYQLTTGYCNTIIGESAGVGATSGENSFNFNVLIGSSVANAISTGSSNVCVGGQAASKLSSGQYNIMIGTDSGHETTSGSQNVYIGERAGYNNTTGSGNIYIGYYAGQDATGDNTLYIANSAGTPLIYGDLWNKRVGINTTDVGFWTLKVNGTAGGTNPWNDSSDIRWKKNVETLDNPLEKILRLRGVKFDWKREEFKDKNFAEGRQIGVIAQELEKEFPELVTTDKDGYKYVASGNITAVLLEAIKAQQQEIQAMKKEIAELKKR